MNPDDEELKDIDIDFFELFEVLTPKEIIKILNAMGGKFTLTEGMAIKKLVDFINTLEDDQIDNLLNAFDEIMSKKWMSILDENLRIILLTEIR